MAVNCSLQCTGLTLLSYCSQLFFSLGCWLFFFFLNYIFIVLFITLIECRECIHVYYMISQTTMSVCLLSLSLSLSPCLFRSFYSLYFHIHFIKNNEKCNIQCTIAKVEGCSWPAFSRLCPKVIQPMSRTRNHHYGIFISSQ